MITWIQKTFQQHFRIVFLVLLAVVIVSFVFVFNASSGIGSNRGNTAAPRPFFGVNLNNNQAIKNEASISSYIQTGRVPSNSLNYAYGRIAMLHIADELHLPTPTTAEIQNYIKNIPASSGINLQDPGIQRVIVDDLRILAAHKLLAGPGYASPSEVQQYLKQLDTTWTLQTATIDRASFKPTPEITATDAELQSLFDNDKARYTIPARVSVSCIEIPAANYPSIDPIDESTLRAAYDANPSRFPKPANTAPTSIAAPSTPDNDFKDVRADVERFVRLQISANAAMQAANELASNLYNNKDQYIPGTSNFQKAINDKRGTQLMLPGDFPVNNVPVQLSGGNPQVANAISQAAVTLGKDSRISNAIATAKGAIILIWQGGTASSVPTNLTEVRDTVTADCIAQKTQKAFVELGQTLRGKIQNAIKTGSTFEQAVTSVTTESGVKTTTQNISTFDLRSLRDRKTTPPENLDGSIIATIETLNKGDLSNMVTMGTGNGRYVYVQDQKLPDLTEANPNYTDIARGIGASTAWDNASIIIQKYINDELKKTGNQQTDDSY